MTGGYPPANINLQQETTAMSPSQHRSGRKSFLLRIDEPLYLKFRKLSEMLNTDMSDILLTYIVKQTKNINLTAEDYERLAEAARGRNR